MFQATWKATTVIILAISTLSCQSTKKMEKLYAGHRESFKLSFLNNPRSPLEAGDTSYLAFYKPDKSWIKKAKFTPITPLDTMMIPTYSGLLRPYTRFGKLEFKHQGRNLTIEVYKSAQSPPNPLYKNHLFLPFKDESNGEETYGGGRYLDLSILDIKKNKRIVLDFNKCYNPWCAYSDGYNCPIPPKVNHLSLQVLAGEKMFLGQYKKK